MMSFTSKHMWCMPPAGFLSRNALIGLCSPSGCNSSTLALGNSTKTTVTPCGGCGSGADTLAPRTSRYVAAAFSRSGTATATWLSFPIMIVSCEPHWLGVENAMISFDNAPVSELRFSKWSRQIVPTEPSVSSRSTEWADPPWVCGPFFDLTPKGRRWQADQPIDPPLADRQEQHLPQQISD